MVYLVSESAVFNRKLVSLADLRGQKRCDESFGHVLQISESGTNIVCMECGATWRTEVKK